jgi:type II secretory pathway pseudopilin PulG
MRLTSVVMAQLSERHYIRRSIGILLALAIVLIILAIAVPKIGGDRMDAIELAVVRDLQTINRMQVQYKSEFQSFAGTLAELGPQAADLIPAALSSGGYAFWLYGERESEDLQEVRLPHFLY